MKTHNWTKRIGIFLIVTMLTFVASWSIQAAQKPITYTYDGKQYIVGVNPVNTPAGGVEAYTVIPSTNYKAYRMGARDTPYTYTGVDVAGQQAQVVTQQPVQETVYEQRTEPVQVVAKVTNTEPIVLEQGETYKYDANAYQPTFSDVQVESRPIQEPSPQVQNLAQPTIQTQDQDTTDVQNEQYQDTNVINYEQDVNHYHEINRYYTHNYQHNLKQVHNNYYKVIDHHQDVHYTAESIEQNYNEPAYETMYDEPVIKEPVRDEQATYEVISERTYTVPVTRTVYQPVVTTVPAPAMPLVQPLAYRTYPMGYGYHGGTGYYGASYYNGVPGMFGNWRYASNWN